MKTPNPRFLLGVLFLLAFTAVPGVIGQIPSTLTLSAEEPATSEPRINVYRPPGKFTIIRTGPQNPAIVVNLEYSGTAGTNDFEELPRKVELPAGVLSKSILVKAKSDELKEGPETVIARIVEPLPRTGPGGDAPFYSVRFATASIRIDDEDGGVALPTASIHADPARTSEPIPTALIVPGRFIVARTGDRSQPLRVYLSYAGTATAADYEALPESVEIPAGQEAAKFLVLAKSDTLVEGTETVIGKLRAAPDATDPAVPGYHIDSAHAEATVEIADEDKGEPVVPVVSILADPGHTSEPSPLIRIAPGVFQIRRSGPNHNNLAVYLSIGGTATPGRDYQALPETVIFEPGQSTVRLSVVPLDDEIVEPDETVVAEIVQPPTAGAVKKYEISGEASGAYVTIHDTDEGPSSATLRITQPEEGRVHARGTPIHIDAVAIDPGGYIPRVEFYANDKLIGVSEIAFFQPPTNGAPVFHEIAWTNAPIGTNVLVARAVDARGAAVRSDSVRVVVVESSKAAVVITHPQNGAEVPAGKPLEISAVAVDPKSYISRVEFYDGTMLLGVSQIYFIVAPPPGTPIYHSFIWTNPPAGQHLLFARANSSEGMVTSEPVQVTAVPGDSSGDRVVLAITAPDSVALESASDNPAVFRIARVSGKRDIAVTARLAIGGTAGNGVDYSELPREVVIPAGREAVELAVKPVPDKAVEGEETVVLELLPPICLMIYPPPLDCYLIEPGHGAARAVIREHAPEPTNRTPNVAIVAPKDGAVVELGDRFSIRAEASDRDGEIERLDIFSDGRLLASAKQDHLTFVWTNPPAGTHNLAAVALDNRGASSTSAVVRVMVLAAEPWVVRTLPDGYRAGASLTVSLRAKPRAAISAWAVEDRPPRGWRVDQVSHEGRFDESTGKVKFGPFADNRERLLSYRARASSTATGPVEFEGVVSADGRSQPIGGDRVLENVSPHHPADLDEDWRIVLDEVTSYAADWREGASGSGVKPSLSYLTRAGMIWRNGEAYRFDGGAGVPPLCWVVETGRSLLAPLAVSTATRVIEGRKVEIRLEPAPGSSASAVVETLPSGWGATDISDGGVFDPATSTVKWGVFLDHQSRHLTFNVVPAVLRPVSGVPVGVFSVDGLAFDIAPAGFLSVIKGADPRLERCERLENGHVRLRMHGPANQLVEIETSDDLETWTGLDTRFLPEGQLDFTDETAHQSGMRYYRLRAR